LLLLATKKLNMFIKFSFTECERLMEFPPLWIFSSRKITFLLFFCPMGWEIINFCSNSFNNTFWVCVCVEEHEENEKKKMSQAFWNCHFCRISMCWWHGGKTEKFLNLCHNFFSLLHFYFSSLHFLVSIWCTDLIIVAFVCMNLCVIIHINLDVTIENRVINRDLRGT
jgi:hypothetical protein